MFAYFQWPTTTIRVTATVESHVYRMFEQPKIIIIHTSMCNCLMCIYGCNATQHHNLSFLNEILFRF